MNMMTPDLISPAQLEHANALLGVWLGDRYECTLSDALAAIQHADREEQALHGRTTTRLISTLLTLRGFRLEGDVWRRAFSREETAARGRQISAENRSAERRSGIAYARAWRDRNKARFDALYGDGGKA